MSKTKVKVKPKVNAHLQLCGKPLKLGFLRIMILYGNDSLWKAITLLSDKMDVGHTVKVTGATENYKKIKKLQSLSIRCKYLKGLNHTRHGSCPTVITY